MVWIVMGCTCRGSEFFVLDGEGVNAYDEKWGSYGRRRTWGDTDPIQKLCIWYSSLIL